MKKAAGFVVAALAAFAVSAAAPGTVKKEGGVGFRFDDNHPLEKWKAMAGCSTSTTRLSCTR